MKPELLSPVQDFTSLKAAIDAGCNAVYFGIKGLNMRAGAKNFALKDLTKITKLCHGNKVKAYLALNVIIYESELQKIKKIVTNAKKAKVDAIICWDFAVATECKKQRVPIHISTQASVANFNSLSFLKKSFPNMKRIILARECSLKDLTSITKKAKKIKVETEVFCHGAMCVSISGRCFLSQHLFNKSANRGECIQPCRRNYIVKDPEEHHELILGDDYVMSPKDLCTLPFLDKLVKTGVASLKIEGRNRSPEYVKTVTESYREALDNKLTPQTNAKLINKLKRVYNRGFSSGFYLGKPINEWARAYGSKATEKKQYIGFITNYFKKVKAAEIRCEAASFKIGDTLIIQGPTTGVKELKISSIQQNNKAIKIAPKRQLSAIKTDFLVRKKDKVYGLVRK